MAGFTDPLTKQRVASEELAALEDGPAPRDGPARPPSGRQQPTVLGPVGGAEQGEGEVWAAGGGGGGGGRRRGGLVRGVVIGVRGPATHRSLGGWC